MSISSGQFLESEQSVTVSIRRDQVSVDAILKACYWFSRDFACEVQEGNAEVSIVHLRPKKGAHVQTEDVRARFLESAMDFALRERVAKDTSEVRDLLLAKAFSESGVLEDQPQGVFGDQIEEAKPDGMFRILNHS
jgi:His-Xaa-Ser system protein HxsD